MYKLKGRIGASSVFKMMGARIGEKSKKWDLKSIGQGFKLVAVLLGNEGCPVLAHRIYRTTQIYKLQSKYWVPHLSSNGVSGLRVSLLYNYSKRWLFGLPLLPVTMCDIRKEANWKTSINDFELKEHLKDLDFIHELTKATVICPNCKNRHVVDGKIPNIEYCHCPDSDHATGRKIDGYTWVPFVESSDLLVWRQPSPDNPDLYVYKVYGKYDDISAKDFLETQLDLEYRKKWDDQVAKLKIVDKGSKDGTDVVHWEITWPGYGLYNNRDYVFARRSLVDEKTGEIVIISRSVIHAQVPEAAGVVRVKEYYSIMNIRPLKNGHGVEFGLTYIDNSGVVLPTWVSNWAALSGMPDFLKKVHTATKARHANGGKN